MQQTLAGQRRGTDLTAPWVGLSALEPCPGTRGLVRGCTEQGLAQRVQNLEAQGVYQGVFCFVKQSNTTPRDALLSTSSEAEQC